MSDPFDDELRRALTSGARDFAATAAVGATRSELLGRIRRRRRQAASLAAVAAAIVVVAGALAAGVGRSPDPSQQIAAGAKAAVSTTTSVAPLPGPPGGSVGLGGGTSSSGGGPTPSGGVTVPGGASTSPSSTIAGAGTPGPGTPPPTTPSTTAATPTSTVPIITPPSVTAAVASSVTGTVTYATSCPAMSVPRASSSPTCAPRHGPARIQLLSSDGSVAASGNAGSNGDFSISVAPGVYTVHAVATATTAAVEPVCAATPDPVTVVPGAATTVAVSCLATA